MIIKLIKNIATAAVSILPLSVLVMASGCINDEPIDSWSLQPGVTLPSFSVTVLNPDSTDEGDAAEAGFQIITDRSFEGKTGYIVFFSTKCSDCRRELPLLEESYNSPVDKPVAPASSGSLTSSEPRSSAFKSDGADSFGGSGSLVLICISRDDSREEVEAFWKEYGLTMPVAIDRDGEVYSKFASSGVPRLYVTASTTITAVYLETFPANPFHIHLELNQ